MSILETCETTQKQKPLHLDTILEAKTFRNRNAMLKF